MVRPKELVESILYVLQNEGSFPEKTNVVGYEPDINSESIKLPLIEVSMGVQIEINDMNTDLVDTRTDSDGNEIGRVYETLYTQDIEISVWTAHGSNYSPRDMSNIVRDTLYRYTTHGPNDDLPHPDIGVLDEVWNLDIIQGEHTDDLGTSPTLRRWQENVEISASERYITDADEPPVSGFNLNDG